MAIQITREEYKKKFGVEPSVNVAPKIAPQPKVPLASKVANFFGAKGITEQFGADIARARAPEAEKGFVEYPQYTRPEIFKKWPVPKLLLSGHHKKIYEWRKKHQKTIE